MSEMILTYEQLYFLGEILNADYIDYRYIKAMPDIQKQYTCMKNQSISALLSAGILREDFMGNLNVMPVYKALLEPLFFGKEEYCIEAFDEKTFLFHVKEESVTTVQIIENKLKIGKTCSSALSGISETMISLLQEQKDGVISCQYAKIGVGGAKQQVLKEKDEVYILEKNGEQKPVKACEAVRYVVEGLEGKSA